MMLLTITIFVRSLLEFKCINKSTMQLQSSLFASVMIQASGGKYARKGFLFFSIFVSVHMVAVIKLARVKLTVQNFDFPRCSYFHVQSPYFLQWFHYKHHPSFLLLLAARAWNCIFRDPAFVLGCGTTPLLTSLRMHGSPELCLNCNLPCSNR